MQKYRSICKSSQVPIIVEFQARNIINDTFVPETVNPLASALQVLASSWTCASSHPSGKQVPDGIPIQLLFPEAKMIAPVGTLYSNDKSIQASDMLVLADVPVSSCRSAMGSLLLSDGPTTCPVHVSDAASITAEDDVVDVDKGPELHEKLVNGLRLISELL